MLLTAALSALLLGLTANAQQAEWAQCGGIGWTGGTTCVSGLVCTELNAYYYQCLPPSSTATTVAPPTTTSHSTTSSVHTTTSSPPVSSPPPTTTSSAPTSTVTGFVKTSGQKFNLNGADYIAVGTNAYWLAQYSNEDIDAAFQDIQNAGFTTVRTWGFNDVTSTSGAGTYYQLWANGVGTLNTGSTGLERFDYVIQSAKAHGIRLVVALTNNWNNYGGMDVYVSQINPGGTHDTFYTDSAIISAYEKYIAGWVNRYLNEPGIMAWELANEPRCGGSTGSPSAGCTSAYVTAWAKTISAYIKSIDSNHLVAIGDEGWINDANPPSYPYQGGTIGIDFAANLNITTLDFGTFHLYPSSWGFQSNETGFGVQWIEDHATIQKQANKPVILEEFGVTDSQSTTYPTWWNTILTTGITGDLYWQAGTNFPDGSVSPQDGYAIYPTSSVYTLAEQAAASMKARG